MIRPVLHIAAHFLVPLAVAKLGYKEGNPSWQRAWMIMSLTMLVDLDHFFAAVTYDPNRCSIGFHPLHQEWAVALYALALLPKPTRLVALGLLIHMFLDAIDCWIMAF